MPALLLANTYGKPLETAVVMHKELAGGVLIDGLSFLSLGDVGEIDASRSCVIARSVFFVADDRIGCGSGIA